MFFKNVKLMFWVDTILCVVYVKNRCPYNVIRNKTPYEMLYGHIPSVKDLKVFGSPCYALIPKVHRNKLGARSCKCISWGIQIPPKRNVSMMKLIRGLLYLEM